MFEEFVNDPDDSKRIKGLYYLTTGMDAEGIKQFLNEYLIRTSYYYNVVTWLDRLLYSVSPLRDMFVKRLEHEAKR